jgi:hypothetical protein
MRNIIPCVVLAFAACHNPSPDPAVSPTRAEVTILSLMTAYESADTALLMDLFWPQATYDDFADQQTYQGIEEIVGYVTGVHAWGDDVYKNAGRIHVTDRGAVAEWLFSATQVRPLGDLAPQGTDREVVLNGVTIIEMDGDRIIRAADYLDTRPLLEQLGARIELPGGQAGGSPQDP